MTIFEEFRKLSDVGFRDIYKKWLYIHCPDILKEMYQDVLDEGISGVVAYCYIDRTEGMSFRPVMLAAIRENSMQVFSLPDIEDTIYIFRFREGKGKMSEMHDSGRHLYLYALNPEEHEFLDLSVLNFETESFAPIKDNIDSRYDAGESVEILRQEGYSCLDRYRHAWFPDDVQANIICNDNGVERVWVRLKFAVEDGGVFGELLNEPFRDCGCHKGNMIELEEIEYDGVKFLVFTGRTAELR